MPSELQNLDSIFNSRVFRIPDYQRGYSWGQQQLSDFWEDLDRLGDQRNHYTGQLTLEKVPDDALKQWDEDTWLIEGKGYKPFYVVDGQQRLITAIILIKCLLDRLSPDQQVAFTEKSDHVKKYLVQTASVSRAYLFGYEKDNPSYEYFKTQILAEPSNQFQGTETTYTANLEAAREFFRQKLKKALHSEIERWFKAVTQKFVFNVYELVEELDAFVVFETMNNRGKPLSKLELLKNRLIYLSTLLPEPTKQTDRRALRRNVNDAWKTVFEFLGRQKDEPLDDDDFLRAHWIMYFIYAREQAGQFSTFLLNEHFTTARVGAGELTVGELQRYVTSVQDSVRKWHELHFPNRVAGLGEQVRRGLERLGRLRRGAFEPLMMAAMQQHGLNDAELTEFLTAAERFVFAISRLCQRRSDTGDSEFYRLAGQLFRQEKTLADATQSVNESTEHYFSAEKAQSETRDLFLRGAGFYSWEGLRYFLFEYEQHLKNKAGMETSKLDWDEFATSKKDHVTIEHIYPLTPVAGEWPSFEGRSEAERASLRNSLGNLLALSQSRNSKFSNRPFATKKQDADGVRGYFNGSFSEIAVAQLADWTPERILDRGLTMLDFLEARWKVSLGTRAEKLKVLNLEFLEPPVETTDEARVQTPKTGRRSRSRKPQDEEIEL
jgi:hypothetical protein